MLAGNWLHLRGSTDTYRVYYMYLVLLSELAGLKVGNALS